MDALHAHPIPAPHGDYEAVVEYERRRVLKEQLVYAAVGTCLDMTMAVGALTGATIDQSEEEVFWPIAEGRKPMSAFPGWGPFAIRLERALFRGDVSAARTALVEFVERFRDE